jgi:hypothetical protein
MVVKVIKILSTLDTKIGVMFEHKNIDIDHDLMVLSQLDLQPIMAGINPDPGQAEE